MRRRHTIFLLAPATVAAVLWVAGGGGGAVVLVVESNAVERDVLEHLLTRAGLTAVAAGGGSAALHLLRHSDPRLLIVGVNASDGELALDFLERVRAEPRWAALPVVVLSEHYRPALASRLDALRVSDLLLKPHLSVDHLLRRVRYYVAAAGPRVDTEAVPLAVAARLAEMGDGGAAGVRGGN